MKLTNPWIGYVQRGYDQIMAAILSRLPTAAPEITDYSYSNPFIKSASVFAGIGEHLGFYVDARARELFLATCRDYASAIHFANLVDYRVRGVLPASVDLQFSLTAPAASPVGIAAGTVCRTKEGLEYRTISTAVLSTGQTTITVPARNWKPVASRAIGVSNGQANQAYSLGQGVVDNNVSVFVGSTPWVPVDTFAYSNAFDTHFRVAMNTTGEFELRFPDGTSGAIPPTGQTLTVSNYTSDGLTGNVARNTITEASGLSVPGGGVIQVNNAARASGGADAQGLEELRKRIPLSLRTLERAVATQDYIDLALLAPGVAEAGLIYQCGKFVDLYVSPIGGGVATADLLATVQAYFDSKKMITTFVQVFAAGEVQLLLRIALRVKANYYRATVQEAVLDGILLFLSVGQQLIRGSVQIGDIYELLENTEGVEYSEVELLSTVPYARPLENTRVLQWERAVQPGSLRTTVWQVSIIGGGEFELLRGNVYQGAYTLDEPQEFEEIEFTISSDASYQNGDSWEFTTYPYSGSIELQEQSVPVTDADHVTIIATGGLV